mmetsp:Transcript_45397/g.89443  ORF Transcript_45397/g.89443 Transcript_45397/m.89443 type:complete len:503 (-) Transcript_45397:366-1874(-)
MSQGSDLNVSPVMRSVNPNAYWSPETQLGHDADGALSLASMTFDDATNAMNLGAVEFVPSRGSTPVPQGGEFVPAQQNFGGMGDEDGGHVGGYSDEGVGGGDINEGRYAAEEEAFTGEEGGAYDPASVDWTRGTPHQFEPQAGTLDDDPRNASPAGGYGGGEGGGGAAASLPSVRRRSNVPAATSGGGTSLQMPVSLRVHLHAQALDLLRQLDPSDERHKEIPPHYHSVFPLDHPSKTASMGVSGSFGYPSAAFKAVHSHDGMAWCLRRIDNARVSPKVCASVQEQWAGVRHPGIVALHRCFTHGKVKALFVVHAYWPTAQSLAERYVGARSPCPEPTLWSYLTQLSATLRCVHHSHGLAVRCLSPQRVLVTSGSRVRVGGVGIVDALESDQVKSVGEQQREDLVALGQCLLTVACRSLVGHNSSANHLRACLAAASNHYTSDLVNTLSGLLFQQQAQQQAPQRQLPATSSSNSPRGDRAAASAAASAVWNKEDSQGDLGGY